MASEHSQRVAEKAKAIYAEELRARLEADHRNRYVAIEPESGDYFVADTFGQAVADARAAHPDRISFVIRIGHAAAIHIGAAAL